MREILVHRMDGITEKEICVPEDLYLVMKKDHDVVEELKKKRNVMTRDLLWEWWCKLVSEGL